MLERFTPEARDVLRRARDETRTLRHAHLGTEHLLLGLLSPDAGIAYAVLHGAGLEASTARAEIGKLAGQPWNNLDDEDAAALRTIGIDLDAVLAVIEDSLGPDGVVPPVGVPRNELLRHGQKTRTLFTPRARKVMGLTVREAKQRHAESIGTEHLLLGLLRDGSGQAAAVLRQAGLDLDELRDATRAVIDLAAGRPVG